MMSLTQGKMVGRVSPAISIEGKVKHGCGHAAAGPVAWQGEP